MEIIYDIFLIINIPIIFWVLLLGIGALMKGWPKIFDKKDKFITRILKFYFWIISILTWLYIIVNGFSQLKSELVVF